MSQSLIVLPDDTAKPILDLIGAAAKSIRIKMFALSEPQILSALIQAHQRAVKIRVMLNPARHSGEIQNKESRSVLRAAGIDVLDSNPAFAVTHEKSMVIDDTIALIGSLNWEPENFDKTRDYAIITTDANEVGEVIDCFEADWTRQPFEPRKSPNLIWCPGAGRESIVQFIESADDSLFVQNERYQDVIIVEHMVRAKLRGVKVRVMARPSHSLRAEQLVEGIGDLRIMQDVGIAVHKIKHFKLHAKMLLADKSRAIIGSINLSPASFDKRRELAIRLKKSDALDRLVKIVRHDWEEGERRDLRPLLHDEVYCIARELLRNAFRHAQARRIEAEIRYESRQLRVHVRDDGKGIAPEILRAGGRAGHFGVSGMRERVDRFGGKLEFWSEAGAGTEALLTVPAAVAYGKPDRVRFSLLRRKKASA